MGYRGLKEPRFKLCDVVFLALGADILLRSSDKSDTVSPPRLTTEKKGNTNHGAAANTNTITTN